ncbi:mediator of RNA polymerase II transcription subunit 15 isoform X2 [Aethina tumida]|uniref:mediator of RNA polymerase II transcription subunit 15 isoform X2 n=1 Tax=Aethina tumida TaxID=116153 RepID=UPI0021488582|nr:mediator of RNA polymerase II transcription subunit 15 isoform X2 [Aethina tumida]
MASEDTSWTTSAFRQSVVAKIDEAIRSSGMNTSRNSMDMENHVYLKAKNKEEYLGFVARLILHIREMNSKKANGMNTGQQQGGPGMPDPINALQNLASQGTRNPIMNGMRGQTQMGGPQQPSATNLIQTLNRGGPGCQQMMLGNMPMQGGPNMNQNTGPMGNQMGTQQMGQQIQTQLPMPMSNTNVNQLQNQINNQLGNQMQNQVQNQMGNQMIGQMPVQIQMGGNLNMQGNMANQMMGNTNQMNQSRPPNMMLIPGASPNFRPQNPQQIFNQSPSPSVQSPAGLVGQPPVASPALAPSPGSQMCIGPPRSVGMAPSPGGSLNTPGQPNPSPMGVIGQDEQAYRDKVRQLSKYIEPLRKMIARIGSDDLEKMSKMKKLLEILSNPSQRMPLDTLLKCEVVLEKIDFKRGDSSVPAATTHLPFKELNPLLEAVSNNLSSPVINHTLHRTFGPTLDALFGPEIKLVPPLKKVKLEEPTSDIPDVLQGEIARLDQRFKVSLDPNQQPGSKSIHLTCWLDDKHLPCVPPVSLIVPEDYPKTAPSCNMAAHEYNATHFLSTVQNALLARIKKLPKHFSVSQLLDTWEMSVRQASSPNASTQVSSTAILMGL